MIDYIIVDNHLAFILYINMRNILIKHFNYKNIFFNNFDMYTKEIAKFLIKFGENKNKKNLKKIKKYYYDGEYHFYFALGFMYYHGINGMLEKNYEESLRFYNYYLKLEGFDKRTAKTNIYFIHRKIKKNLKNKNKNFIKNNTKYSITDEELINLEKEILNLYLDQLTNDNIKLLYPSFFYILAKIYGPNSIKHKDKALEYVFLNMASNSELITKSGVKFDYFYEKYCIYKSKQKIKEKNKDKNFKEIKEAKGAINVGGYGDDGDICPICLDKKKSTICIPCKHFFCSNCIQELIKNKSCPLCRIEIKATFDMDKKEEKLIESKNDNSILSFSSDSSLNLINEHLNLDSVSGSEDHN